MDNNDLVSTMTEMGPAIDDALSKAAQIAASIVDENTRDIAIRMAEQVQSKLDILSHPEKGDDPGGLRERYYLPAYRHAEDLRVLLDPRIKQGKAINKTLLSGVSDFNMKKEREECIVKEAREAEARRIVEEAARLQREAEAAAARAKAAAEAEEQRKRDAEAAEQRRIQAEKEAKERQERDAREASAREIQRKLKEEEDHRLAHAQEAQDQGAGQKVDGILSNPTPISPTLAIPRQAPDQATLQIEQEQARKVAQEKADKESSEAAEAKRKLDEAEAAAAKAQADADAAALAAATAQAAAASAIVTRPDSRTTASIRYSWELASDGTWEGDIKSFAEFVNAIAAGRAPREYLTDFDQFRAPAVGEDVTKLREKFVCPGLRAYPVRSEYLNKRRKVGGRVLKTMEAKP
jgi:hypothetical protein